MNDVFSRLLHDALLQRRDIHKREESIKWFRNEARLTSITPEQVFREPTAHLTTMPAIGQMQLFMYDPKLKHELPYYDLFPLTFCIEHYNDGFLGINFHYLPLPLRAKLMDALYANLMTKKLTETTRMAVNYGLLKSAAKYQYYKVCIKRYLYKHVRSRFIVIPATRWDYALFLPLENFQKQNKTYVRRQARQQFSK